jgi:dihydrodipicolinate synthase/N-acetylneuraminate lyase
MQAANRRGFLSGAISAGVVLGKPAFGASGNVLSGIYPIAWTPCRPDGVIDRTALTAQLRFCDQRRVRGLVWPQNASAWSTLSDQEWHDGVTALLETPRPGGAKVIIGIQTTEGDPAASAARARFAADKGADGIISLSPQNANRAAIVTYYQTVGAATPLPMMMQAVGDVDVDLIVEIYRKVPTLKAVKDEAGDPLKRAPQILAQTKLRDFSGGGGKNLLTEMQLGFSGSCPYVGFADLFQKAFDLWQTEHQTEAFDMLGRVLAFNSIPGANEYILTARGVFPEDVVLRRAKGAPPAKPLDAAQKQFMRDNFQRFLGAYTRA